MPISIRKAKVSDSATIINFQISMAMETENLALDPITVSKGVAEVFKDRSKGIYYIATDGGKSVGSMLLTGEWSDWRNGTVLWFQSVYVLPEYRRKGIFRMMYYHVQNLVRNNDNLKGLRLYVDRSNLTAQRVYASIGMNGDHYRVFEWMKPGPHQVEF